jgi:hypothetical protein
MNSENKELYQKPDYKPIIMDFDGLYYLNKFIF